MAIETDYLKGRSPEMLMKILKEKGVQLAVDIRDGPAYPIYYRPKSFETICKNNGIDYLYKKDLGNPKWNREKNKNNPEEERRVYLELLKTEEKRIEAVKEVRTIIKEGKQQICLICMCEASPADELGCHRFWLKKVLETP